MRALSKLELNRVAAGISDFDIFSGSVIGGTLLGAGLGGYMALNSPSFNPWRLFLFPIWIAAGAGLGGLMGLTVGAFTGVCGICVHHLTPLND